MARLLWLVNLPLPQNMSLPITFDIYLKLLPFGQVSQSSAIIINHRVITIFFNSVHAPMIPQGNTPFM